MWVWAVVFFISVLLSFTSLPVFDKLAELIFSRLDFFLANTSDCCSHQMLNEQYLIPSASTIAQCVFVAMCCISGDDWPDRIRIALFRTSLDSGSCARACVCDYTSASIVDRKKGLEHWSRKFIYYLFRAPYCDKDKWYAIKYMFQQRNSFLLAAALFTASSSLRTLRTLATMRSCVQCSLVTRSEVWLVKHLYGIIYYIYSTIKHTWTWSIFSAPFSLSLSPT